MVSPVVWAVNRVVDAGGRGGEGDLVFVKELLEVGGGEDGGEGVVVAEGSGVKEKLCGRGVVGVVRRERHEAPWFRAEWEPPIGARKASSNG